MNFKKQVRNDRNLTQESRENSIASKKYASKFPLNDNLQKKIKSLASTIFENQNSLKIKLRERRPGKGRLGGERAAFATLSWVPSIEKMPKKKIKSSQETKPTRETKHTHKRQSKN
jgi:hypothetical protein